MVFDPKQRFYLRNPGQFGQDVSSDQEIDPALIDEAGIGQDIDGEPEADVPEESGQPGTGIRDLADTYEDWQGRFNDVRQRINKNGSTGIADQNKAREELHHQGPRNKMATDGNNSLSQPNKDWTNKLKSPGSLWDEAREARRAGKAAMERAAKTGAKQAGQAAGKAAAGTAARAAVGAGGLAAAEAIGAATGPVGWAIDAVLILGQAAYAFSKTKVFRWMLAGFFFVAACFMLLVGAGNKAILQSGLNGASEVIRTFATNAFLPITAAQSIVAFIQDIDQISTDISRLVQENPALTAKAAEVDSLLAQLTALKNEIEPTAGSGGMATAEQLQKYNNVILQLKKLFEGDREGTAALVLAANEGGSLRLTETGCNTLKDIKNLSVTTKTMKVILAAAEYGKSTGKTIRVTCLVSGHRKYVRMAPSKGYPYCGQPDNALSAGFSPSRMSLHCSGRAIDFGGIDTGFGTYLNTHREELEIEDILLERDTNHIHVEVKP